MCTTALGSWYASLMRWRRPLVLLVNEITLLPAVMPLAPAVGLARRIPHGIAATLTAHGVPAGIIQDELYRMDEVRVGPTANRSVVGVMVEFSYLAEAFREGNPQPDLVGLAMRLARVPCSPLYTRHVSPDRELAALFDLPEPQPVNPE
jgi:hypothetical protein